MLSPALSVGDADRRQSRVELAADWWEWICDLLDHEFVLSGSMEPALVATETNSAKVVVSTPVEVASKLFRLKKP
jgi:hypothetical protein